MFIRKAHILRRNKSNEMPRRFIFFDTETDTHPIDDTESELFLKMGTACYTLADAEKKEWRTFKNIPAFWSFVFSRLQNKTTTYLIAHNLPFDFRILKGFAEMSKRKFEQGKIIFEGTTNIFTFEGTKGRRLVFLDNMNFFKLPLAVLGDNIGLKKLNIESDDLESYCRRDVEIMIKAWEMFFSFLKLNDLGNFAPTIAGQALNAFRHKFMNHEIFIHNKDSLITDERESYHGGRTECFKLGKFPKNKYRMYDVNSMYPAMMKKYDYPVKYTGTLTAPSHEKLRVLLKSKCLIGMFLICSPFPVFPVKDKGKLIFPIGRFWAMLTTREIEYARVNKMIMKTGRVHIYDRKNIFSEYVDFFYQKKKEYKDAGNDSFTYICKLFLNSLYGKFGQKNKFYEDVKIKFKNDGNYWDADKDIQYRVINGRTQKFSGWREGIESFVAIPAHITADARMRLWEIITAAGQKNVFYCDTDSIITTAKMPTGKNLGELSLKEESANLIIYGNKDYVFGKTETIKGIKKNATRLSPDSFEQIQFEGMNGAIRNNRINEVRIKKITKKLKRDYDKGIVLYSGVVRPYSINNLI